MTSLTHCPGQLEAGALQTHPPVHGQALTVPATATRLCLAERSSGFENVAIQMQTHTKTPS